MKQKKAGEEALPAARVMTARAIRALENMYYEEGANLRAYIDFFGDEELAVVNENLSSYKKIQEVLRGPIKFKYLPGGTDVYAQTSWLGVGSVIYICDVFLRPDKKNFGIDSRGGTIVHEISHQALGTLDYNLYGERNAKYMAAFSTALAMSHADNWEYFAESVQ